MIVKNKKQIDKIKGEQFEDCVASLLREDGWEIHMNRDKGKRDEGIDIIAKKGHTTALIQCKYRSDKSWTLGDESFNKLYASAKAYEVKHPENNIHVTVVTTGKFYEDTKDKASTLGIELVEAKTIGLKFRPNI